MHSTIKEIKGVILDFRNTLIDVDSAYEKANNYLFSFFKKYNSKLEKKEYQNLLNKRLKYMSSIQKNYKNIHDWMRILMLLLMEDLNIDIGPISKEELFYNYQNIFIHNIKLFPDALKTMCILKKKKIKICVIIDGLCFRENLIIDRLKIRNFFDTIIISENIGLNKFTDRPLKEALKKMNLSNNKLLVIGDRVDKDIIHARKLGIKTVIIRRKTGRGYLKQNNNYCVKETDFCISSLIELKNIISKPNEKN